MSWAHRVDIAQPAIVEGLRTAGYPVFQTSRLGNGFPDLLVGSKAGHLVLLEIKSKGKKLTPEERKFHQLFITHPIFIVETLAEAKAKMAQHD
jgi:hypothetical protein